MTSENSAQRLYDFFIQFGELSRGKNSIAALEIWKAVWGIGEDELFIKILTLNDLISDVEKKILSDPQVINKARYLSWVHPMRRTLFPSSLMGSWTSVQSPFYEPNGVYMVALEFCSEALSKSCGENKISDESIAALRSNLDALISDIRETIHDEKTRSLLLDLLMGLEFGLRNFQVRGPTGLEESLDLALGKLSRHKSALSANSTPESTGVVKKILGFLKSAGEVIDNSKKVADGLSLAGKAYDHLIANLPS